MLLMIDNYDSFTYNLVQYLGELGQNIKVFRNDKITLNEIEKLRPEKIVISPGPCTPNEAGVSVDLIKTFCTRIPIFGVCLGHQSIGAAFNADIVRADRLMHGKTSLIYHDNRGIFKGIPNPFEATRYHSLIIKNGTLSEDFEITAWTDADEIMGVRHKSYPLDGVQFHPESILTKAGKDILSNFLTLADVFNSHHSTGGD
ncbi:MAG: aminodeoxychorismate/anthranilate synthase component II [Nitrospirae bacterium]|nr:aminodeoxychorismate/anthranilate synthase component II [Nitrospirota bacterium]MBF0534483.1 aminodeoxychorismate/anthranilate synthase component II [Nitrospirota bacterium]MBF0617109.1 aminodeoxychorismate/anthranilate synthase component II [Nitrospirota bacterium]